VKKTFLESNNQTSLKSTNLRSSSWCKISVAWIIYCYVFVCFKI